MNTCTSCTRKLPREAFIHKGKLFKTCSSCLSKKQRKAKQTAPTVGVQTGSTETSLDTVSLQEISGYIGDVTAVLEPGAKLALNLSIKLDDEALTTASHDVKLLAKVVVDMVEDGDGYSWV